MAAQLLWQHSPTTTACIHAAPLGTRRRVAENTATHRCGRLSPDHRQLWKSWASTRVTVTAFNPGTNKGKGDFWYGVSQSVVSEIGRTYIFMFFRFYYCLRLFLIFLNSKIIWPLLTQLTFFSVWNLWRSLLDFSAIKSLCRIGSHRTQS